MATTRYTAGSVTVTLDGGLEELVRRTLDAVAGETVRILEETAGGVAVDARSAWYAAGTGVRRRTGRSGDVEVVTTVSDSEVRVSVGSTDMAKAKYVHRPGRLSTVPREISRDDYYKLKREGGISAALVFHARKADKANGVETGKYYRKAHNPESSDGKFLLVELVRKPAQAAIKAVLPDLGRTVSRKAGGT